MNNQQKRGLDAETFCKRQNFDLFLNWVRLKKSVRFLEEFLSAFEN